MFSKLKKLGRLMALSLGSLFCIVGCAVTITELRKLGEPNSQMPVKSLVLVVEQKHRENLYNQLKKYADKHGLEYAFADFGTDGEHVQVSMAGANIEIITNVYQESPNKFFANFYPRNIGDPPPDNIDEWVGDFINFVKEVPDIEIVE